MSERRQEHHAGPPAEWEAWLCARLGKPVHVRFGRSRGTPLRVEQRDCSINVHMHRFFVAAPDEIRESLARWIRAGRRARKACAQLDGWIDARLAELPPRPIPLQTFGVVHDLDPLAESLCADEFQLDFAGGRPRPRITWGRRARSLARHSLLLGSYQRRPHLVRIHPVLDQTLVPAWFVRYILFHEMLHAVVHSAHSRHSPEFCARELEYPEYERARVWESRHIGHLIRSARKRPARPGARQGRLFSF